jgi:hypothetical protein
MSREEMPEEEMSGEKMSGEELTIYLVFQCVQVIEVS